MRVSSRDEIQVGRGCRVSGGRHPFRLRRRQRAEWDVQGRRCSAAGERGTTNAWMAPGRGSLSRRSRSSGESPEEIAARDPIYAEYRRKTADIEQEDDWGSGNSWVTRTSSETSSSEPSIPLPTLTWAFWPPTTSHAPTARSTDSW